MGIHRADGNPSGRVRWLGVTLLAGVISACTASRRQPAVRGLPKDDPLASLSIVWVGHATALIRLGHRMVMTDPNLNESAIVIQQRVTPPSLRPDEVPPLQLILVSHLHVDHFDTWTLKRLPRSAEIVFPPGSTAYYGLVKQARKTAGEFWKPIERGGLRVTPVPVRHSGGRFLVDALWNHGYTGYVIEGDGRTVFFAGDTGWDKSAFAAIRERFPKIDVALIPIAPAKGLNRNHANPKEAVDIFEAVGARYMIPIHYEAYHSMAVPIDEPRKELEEEIQRRGLRGRVFALRTGERFIEPDDGSAPRISNERE